MHTFTLAEGTPPVTWDDFQFVSYTPLPNHGGNGIAAAANATFNPDNQLFSWQSVGAPLGTYVWSVRATNVVGFDTGTLTITTVTPEPASALLACLGFLALAVGCIRRSPRA
jgi:hypothetical protein